MCVRLILIFYFEFSQSALFRELVAQSCLTLCNPMDCSSPGSSVHGILQARILESVAIPFSNTCFLFILSWDMLRYPTYNEYNNAFVQSLSHAKLFETTWTPEYQASLSFTPSQSLLRFMSIELVMPFNHLFLCCPLLFLPSIFPSIRAFSKSQLFSSGGQSIGASASASVLSMNTQDWFHLGLMGVISLLSKGLSGVFLTPSELSEVFSSTIQKHQFFGIQSSLWSNSSIHTWLLEKPQLWLYGCFPGGSAGKESTCNAGDLGSIPGLERSPENWVPKTQFPTQWVSHIRKLL